MALAIHHAFVSSNSNGPDATQVQASDWNAALVLTGATVGDVPVAASPTVLGSVAAVAIGSYFRSAGVAALPVWSTLLLPNAATATRIPYATATNTWGESGNLTFSGTVLKVTGSLGISVTPTSAIDVDPGVTTGVSAVSGLSLRDHTVTLSGANPTTYATMYAAQIGAMSLVAQLGGQTVTDAAGLAISVPKQSVGAVTNSHGLLVLTTAVSSVVSAYGATINAPTGASANYAAQFLGGNVGIGVSTPQALLDVRGAIGLSGANGEILVIKSLTELTTIAAAAFTDTAIQFPAGSIVIGASVRVTVAIPTATTFTLTSSGGTSSFGNVATSTAINSTEAGLAPLVKTGGSAQAVRITPNVTPGTNVGRVRVTIYYLEATPPTS